MKQIAFETVDVFTETRFGGNPLAVIPDARELSSDEMQAIAREFKYSESTFVLPPAEAANTARVRIFTPASEIPFAGHPNVGTAFVLGRVGTLFGQELGAVMRFEEGAGLVTVEVVRRDGTVTGASISAPQKLERSTEIAPDVVAACASIDAQDVVSENHKPLVASVGLPFVFAQLSSLESLARAAPDAAAFARARTRYGGSHLRFSLFLYVRLSKSNVRARMFAPLSNVTEDPATGSASAALGGLLASLERGSDAFSLIIEQGVEMGRPSLIEVRVDPRGIAVSGSCVPVMRGVLTL